MTGDGSGEPAAATDLPLATSDWALISSAAALGDRVILTGASDGAICAWDAESGRPLRDFPTRRPAGPAEPHPDAWRAPESVAALAVSPDGRLALAGDAGHAVYLWDLATGAGRPVGTHADKVRAVAFSPDGRRAVSHDGDQIRTWDLSDPASPRPLKVWRANVTLEYGVAFSPDGRRVLAVSHHGDGAGVGGRDGVVAAEPRELERDRGVEQRRRRLLGRRGAGAGGPERVGRVLGRLHRPARSGTWAGTGAACNPWRPAPAAAGPPRPATTGRCGCGTCPPAARPAPSAAPPTSCSPSASPATAAGSSPAGSTARSTSGTWAARRRTASSNRSFPPPAGALQARPDDAEALKTMGEWWAFRGRWDWAASLLEQARAGGADVPSLTLARSRAATGSPAAAEEFRRAPPGTKRGGLLAAVRRRGGPVPGCGNARGDTDAARRRAAGPADGGETVRA